MQKTRILGFLILAAALALPALAFEVAEISLKELEDGSIVEFESSFCEVAVGDTVSVMLTGDEGDAATVEVVAAYLKSHNAATPNRGKKKGGSRTASITPVIAVEGRSVSITLDAADEGWHTVHARLELSSGDKLGVNLHSTPCEEDEEEEEETQ
jgi:plastocyanin